MATVDPGLPAVLERARALGFLGPGAVDAHVTHALAFASAVDDAPARALDLGSGGGVPGLVLASGPWAGAAWLLLDASERRCAFLAEVVAELGLGDHVEVRRDRAEVAGRDAGLRAAFDVVVARGFAPPAVTAECGAPFLRPGGNLVVSDPPAPDPDRWPADGLAAVGLTDDGSVAGPVHLRRLRQAVSCPDRYPRRDGMPAKRPLW
jgi:16S rRNA (guanine527-N7)-methyltransferase